MSLINYNFRRRFPSMLEDFFTNADTPDFLRLAEDRVPRVNIAEDEDKFAIEVAAPGMQKDDFSIELDNEVLSISSEAKQESETKDDRYTRKEFSYTSFKRSFTLPQSADGEKIEAKYEDGILYVHIPKREEAKPKQPKRINVG
ncbi:MAG: Hsp20/alpha crystallin family protein [Bernardetiaceae bacterium]|nr:Hsp20/alpha crystallin family protein [Bernardetiaceae bacterium]